MGEWFPGSITIGGQLPHKKSQEFIEVLRSEGVGLDWGDNGLPDDIKTAGDLQELATKNGGWLQFYDDQARYGRFEDLECWLRENNIPYDRHSDSHHEFSAELVKYRPALGEVNIASDEDGNELCNLEPVIKARAALNEGNVHAALKYLDDVVGKAKDVGELPKFEVLAYASKQSEARRSKKGAHRRR